MVCSTWRRHQNCRAPRAKINSVVHVAMHIRCLEWGIRYESTAP